MLITTRHTDSPQSPYHGISGLTRAIAQGTDIVTVAVRTTKDNVLILADSPFITHDAIKSRIRHLILKEIQRRTAGTKQPVVRLSDVLSKLYGSIMLSLEIGEHTAVEPLLRALQPYTKRKTGWGNLIICSSNPFILRKIRRAAPFAQLCLIHGRHTPLTFVAWQPSLQLSAVYIHRLSVTDLVVEAAHRLDILVCAYTVDRPKTMKRLEAISVDAVVTNHPEKLL